MGVAGDTTTAEDSNGSLRIQSGLPQADCVSRSRREDAMCGAASQVDLLINGIGWQ